MAAKPAGAGLKGPAFVFSGRLTRPGKLSGTAKIGLPYGCYWHLFGRVIRA
jgi:hypothetical protein